MTENPNQPRAATLPWENTEDAMGVNLAIGSLRDSLLAWLKTERGVHAETLLVSIGALAGFAAQHAAWARIAKRDIPASIGASLHTATTKSGETFYFGDLINGYLVYQGVTDLPLFSFVAAAALAAGVKHEELPDYRDMFAHVSKTFGLPEFGVPRVSKDHQPHVGARQALNLFWPQVSFIFTRTDGPGPAKDRNVPTEYWPLIAAIVAQQFLTLAKDTLDPRIGFVLVMESAIAMSKVDPKTVPQTVPE